VLRGMTATVNRRGGRVEAVNFRQAHNDSIGSDYSACETLVEEALRYMPPPVDSKFDAFKKIDAAK